MAAAHANDYDDVDRLTQAGKLDEAMARADQFLAAQPRDPQMRFLRGVAQLDAGKRNEAITTFTQLTQDVPELPEPYNNLAVIYAGQGQFDKARAVLESAIKTNPSYATAHENLGDIYARLASQSYSVALQIDPRSSAVPAKLAVIRTLFATPPGSRPALVTAAAASSPGKSNNAQASIVAAAPPKASPKETAATVPAPPPPPVIVAAAVPAKPAASASSPAKVAPQAAALSAPTTPVSPVTPPVPASAPVAAAAAPVAPPLPSRAAAAAAIVPEKPAASTDAADVVGAVRNWAAAWASRDMNAYLASYGSDFAPGGGQDRSAWEEERRARIVGKGSIAIEVQNLVVDVNGSSATARFRQAYRADGLKVTNRKTLELVRQSGGWRIRKETVGG